jgi:pre-mRNA-splicing helicase BRR2
MECAQMVTQALWDADSPLLQLPHVTKELAAACKAAGVESVFDLMDMEDGARRALLQLPATKLDDIARFCNQYPNIEVAFEVEEPASLRVGESVVVNVSLDRDLDDEELAAAQRVVAPRYPREKLEGWWVALGDPKTNALLAIKRVTLNKAHLDVRLRAVAGDEQHPLADAGGQRAGQFVMVLRDAVVVPHGRRRQAASNASGSPPITTASST